MTHDDEQAELRALIADAWPHRGTPELREHAERIGEWAWLRALARIDLRAMSDAALARVDAELRRRERVAKRDDELVDLLRRTHPANLRRAA